MSTYLTAPGVERAMVGVYPKRHSGGSFPRVERKATKADVASESLAGPPRFAPDVCYTDFFVNAAAPVQVQVA